MDNTDQTNSFNSEEEDEACGDIAAYEKTLIEKEQFVKQMGSECETKMMRAADMQAELAIKNMYHEWFGEQTVDINSKIKSTSTKLPIIKSTLGTCQTLIEKFEYALNERRANIGNKIDKLEQIYANNESLLEARIPLRDTQQQEQAIKLRRLREIDVAAQEKWSQLKTEVDRHTQNNPKIEQKLQVAEQKLEMLEKQKCCLEIQFEAIEQRKVDLESKIALQQINFETAQDIMLKQTNEIDTEILEKNNIIVAHDGKVADRNTLIESTLQEIAQKLEQNDSTKNKLIQLNQSNKDIEKRLDQNEENSRQELTVSQMQQQTIDSKCKELKDSILDLKEKEKRLRANLADEETILENWPKRQEEANWCVASIEGVTNENKLLTEQFNRMKTEREQYDKQIAELDHTFTEADETHTKMLKNREDEIQKTKAANEALEQDRNEKIEMLKKSRDAKSDASKNDCDEQCADLIREKLEVAKQCERDAQLKDALNVKIDNLGDECDKLEKEIKVMEKQKKPKRGNAHVLKPPTLVPMPKPMPMPKLTLSASNRLDPDSSRENCRTLDDFEKLGQKKLTKSAKRRK